MRGEVLALAGIDGNGQGELADTRRPGRRVAGGRIVLDGVDITRRRRARAAGRRHRLHPRRPRGTSLVQGMTIEDNLVLRDFARPPFSRGALPALRSGRWQARQSHAATSTFALPPPRCRRARCRAATSRRWRWRASGARAAGADRLPADLGAGPGPRASWSRACCELRARGAAVLYISSELERGAGVGDRIGVLSRRAHRGVVEREDADLNASAWPWRAPPQEDA